MGIKFTSSGLNHLVKKLDKMEISGTASAIAEAIADEGVSIARRKYRSAYPEAVVTKEISLETGNAKVIASGDKIAYLEFGTGLVGQGTYKGKLPTETITFKSPKDTPNREGVPQSTAGWVYYYDNPLTKVNGGWYYGGKFTEGQPAKAQMFETAQELKKNIKEIVVKQINKRSVNK